MDVKTAAEKLGMTYRRANYLVGLDVISPEKPGPGKPFELSFRDLVELELANRMREAGYRFNAIIRAFDVLREGWKTEDPEKAGGLAVMKGENFKWLPSNMFVQDGEKRIPFVFPDDPNIYFDVQKIAFYVREKLK